MAGLSGSNEVKTANAKVSATGTTDEVRIDAQEDREIVGTHLTLAGSGDGIGRAYVGTSPQPDVDDVNDNRGFYQIVDDPRTTTMWFGDGSGIEWNEDATLTVECEETGGSNSLSHKVTVYYREL